MEEDLVIKKGKSYRLSNVGIIQKNTLEWMGKTLRCLKDHETSFLSHDLSGIPNGFQVTIGVVCERCEIIENDPAVPNHIQEIIIPLLAKSRAFLVASSTLVPEHQLTAARVQSTPAPPKETHTLRKARRTGAKWAAMRSPAARRSSVGKER